MITNKAMKAIGATALLAAVLVMAAACSNDKNPLSPEEGAALLSMSPVGGSELVAPTDPIVLTFDRAMNPAVCEPLVILYEGDRNGPVVEVTYEWSEDGTVLTVTPVEALKPLTTYTLYVGGGLRDQSGRMTDLSQGQQHSGGRWVEEDPAYGYGPNGECETPTAQGSRHAHQHRSRQMGLVFTFTTGE